MPEKSKKEKPQLNIRNGTTKDIPGISELIHKVYPGFAPYPPNMIRGQINNFPEGNFIATFDEKIVGYCCSILIDEKIALSPHDWRQITGGGYGSTHDPKGNILYGYEICVDPEYRGLKIGQRFYKARKNLCNLKRLKGIVFGGRLPNLKKQIKKVGTVEKYIELVKEKKIRDPVLNFQLRNGFEILGVLKDYLPSDTDSLGYAAHLIWKNPSYVEESKKPSQKPVRVQDSVRLTVVQYEQRRISSFDEFTQICNYFVDVVADYKADFVLFPELFTLQLLSVENEMVPPHEAVETISGFTDRYKSLFYDLAIKYNVNIIGGTHPTKMEDGKVQNISYVFLRDGSIHTQPKIHPTPNEQYWWNFEGGDHVTAIDTDCGPIGVLICYDAEFPELSRHLVDQGANLLFVPFLTDEKQSYNRVRFCCQARAVENQVYVALAGNVGNLPRVINMDIHYGQSCILTPCDFPFAREGVAADTTPNVEMVAIADVRMDDLFQARRDGTVKNLRDRRHDLYTVTWHHKRKHR